MYPTLLKRLTGLGVCAALAVGWLVGAVVAPASAHPGPPSAMFDPNSVSWTSFRNQTPGDFNATVAAQRSAGRIAVDIDADPSGDSYVLAGVFQRNLDDRDWQLLFGLTGAGLQQAWSNAAANGMRFVDFETYVVDGTRFYAGLWVENVENYAWTSRWGMTYAELLEYRNHEQAAGRLPIDIDQYQVGNDMRYAAAFVRNAENLSWHLLVDSTSAEFSAVYDALNGTHRPLVADSTPSAAGQRYSAIWIANTNGRGWAIRRNMTIQQYADVWSDLASAGFRVINFERYETDSGTRYLAIWRQNS